ncbi:MAG: ABC-2 transporter permease [Roseburia sp.]|nr:ABC-2 transporter permease [Anaeroplasma bactoclasticum]MCM1196011.1 ABC-2 transporter permease [Roseburia sp.]MCM1556841.1 ABC-2 transporter permease [Anaeroplasma bactoclasticum]
MKKVFIFEMKKLLIPLVIYFGIMSIIGFTVILTSYSTVWRSFTLLYGLFGLFLIIGVIYLVFSYNKKRISADMTYSLPVTKRELFIGKYLASIVSILGMMIIYLLLCLIIFLLARTSNLFNKYTYDYLEIGKQLGNFVLGSLIHIGMSIPLFNFLLLFYYKANTVLDGIAFTAIGLALLQMGSFIILQLVGRSVPVFLLNVYVRGPLYFLDEYFAFNSDRIAFYSLFSIYIISGTLLFIYLLWFSKRDCSIRTQGICDGIFGYKVFLPLLGVFIPLLTISSMGWNKFEWLWFILTVVGLFIGYCIYHRSVKFSKLSYILFGATIGFDFIFLILSFVK